MEESKANLYALILAGGDGTRLRHRTGHPVQPLAPHAARPRRRPLGQPPGRAYAALPPWNFPSGFLACIPQHLLVVRVADSAWSDWSTPQAIARTFAGLKERPPCMSLLGRYAGTDKWPPERHEDDPRKVITESRCSIQEK